MRNHRGPALALVGRPCPSMPWCDGKMCQDNEIETDKGGGDYSPGTPRETIPIRPLKRTICVRWTIACGARGARREAGKFGKATGTPTCQHR